MEKIKGREYKVTQMPTQELTKANLIANGWDGFNYMLEGKRGACYIACRHAKTNELHILTTLRF